MNTYNQMCGGYVYLNDNFNTKHTVNQYVKLQNVVNEIEETVNYKCDLLKFHLVSFASTNTNFSKERFYDEAATFGFSYIKIYTENDFSDDYLQKYSEHFKDIRGYGYWSWKSYIIKEELLKLSDDEYLVYADCGCSFNKRNVNIFSEIWFSLLNNSKTGIICPSKMQYLEMNWNKADCVNYINERYHTNFQFNDSFLKQNAATVILFRPTDTAKQFVDEWFDICNNHYDLITDKPSNKENPYLREHRHDQSVFSLLCHIYNVSTIDTFHYGIDDRNNAPIYALKIKNDKNEYMNKQINNNVDIFICTHRDFEFFYNPVYKIVCGQGQLKNNYPMEVYEDNLNDNPEVFPKEYSYAEGSRINYIRRNVQLKDYVGLAHYRKYIEFDKNPSVLPDFNELFKNYDIVLLNPQYHNMFQYYNVCHFGTMLNKCIEIGRTLFPEYNNEFDKVYQPGQPIYYCNMFVMKTEDFYNMCDFVYSILSKFDNLMEFNTDKDIHTWVEQHINETNGMHNIEYQSRADGFLTERLFTIWVWHNFSQNRIYTRALNTVGDYQVTYKKTQQ